MKGKLREPAARGESHFCTGSLAQGRQEPVTGPGHLSAGVLTSLCEYLHRLVRSECHIHRADSRVICPQPEGLQPSPTNGLALELFNMTAPNTQMAKLTGIERSL